LRERRGKGGWGGGREGGREGEREGELGEPEQHPP